MAWIEHAIWWHIFPLGFVGAERTGDASTPTSHRFGHIEAWLDYVLEMGASGIALGPIFASSTHGYDTVDHFRIDPRLGDEADFDRFIKAAKQRGIRVLLDGVFNHVGRDFPPFQEVLSQGPSASRASWFKLSWPAGSTEPEYGNFEGHHQLVALNHDEPEVAAYVGEVVQHWLDRGVDGWRLDAAYAVPPPFWAKVLPGVRSRFPEAYFVGEVIHGDYAEIVRESGIDSVTQYELWKAIWSSICEKNFFELDWTLKRHNALLDSFVPLTFIGNHDVTRIATQVGSQHLAHATVLLFTLAGTPSIYSGDEQAFQGRKEHRQHGDDAVRPPFPLDPSGLSPMGGPIFRLHRELIGIRRRNSWLHTARTSILHLANEQLAFRTSKGEHGLIVVLNLGDNPASMPTPKAMTTLAGEADLTRPGAENAEARVPAHGWVVLQER